MRVAFMGFLTWGQVTLRALVESGHDIALVITHPEPTSEFDRSFNDSVKEYAESKGIQVTESNVADKHIIETILAKQPEIIVLSNWRKHLPLQLIEGIKHGAINVHRSLLPRFAGLAPINWAIASGESITGVTIHSVTNEFDLGDILSQERIPIGPTETATEVFHKTTPLIMRMVPTVLRNINEGTGQRYSQNPEEATFYHRRLERDLRIEWTKSNTEIFNLIRAQSDPFPNAFTFFRGRKLRIKTASLPVKRFHGTPGRVFERTPNSDGVIVVCGSGSFRGQGLVLHVVQLENDEPIFAGQFFKNLGIYLGE